MDQQTFLEAYTSHSLGFCGFTEPAALIGQIESQEARIRVLAFGAVLDLFLQGKQWQNLERIAESPLLEPSWVAYQDSKEIAEQMRQMKLGGPQYNARVWWQICRGVQGRFQGSFSDLLAANEGDVRKIQAYLRKSKTTFPVISGDVVSGQWLDWCARIGGVDLYAWEDLRVKLPASLLPAAEKIGADQPMVHPQVYGALLAWEKHCAGLGEDFCGFAGCWKR
ncbi:hypothetical protein KQH61_05630 [bacterium]|nr:hypothetical protein [bacterium]MCB2179383.1 hypothetical protein [bacterium]